MIVFSNGQEVVKYFDELLRTWPTDSFRRRQPVSLLLLDINMPVLNGYETLLRVKQTFSEFNDKQGPDGPKVVRPMICYMSQM